MIPSRASCDNHVYYQSSAKDTSRHGKNSEECIYMRNLSLKIGMSLRAHTHISTYLLAFKNLSLKNDVKFASCFMLALESNLPSTDFSPASTRSSRTL
jgi:hypothetical protein